MMLLLLLQLHVRELPAEKIDPPHPPPPGCAWTYDLIYCPRRLPISTSNHIVLFSYERKTKATEERKRVTPRS